MIREGLPALLALSFLLPFGGKAHRETEKGNRAYEQQAWEEALRAYTEAQLEAPEAPELHYDIGNVLYRQKDYAKAGEAYTRALTSAPSSLSGRAAYNLGNALFMDQRYPEAIQAYRRSLEADPSDAEAKRNLELALRALQVQQQQQQQRQQPQPDQDSKEGGQRRPQDQGPEGGPAPPPGERPPGGSEGQRPLEMSPEEAARLLDGVEQQERERLRRQAAERGPREAEAPEEDW